MMEKPQAVLVCSVNIGKFIIPGSVIKTSKCRLKSHLFILRKNCFTLLPGALGDVIAAICAAATSLTSHTGSEPLASVVQGVAGETANDNNSPWRSFNKRRTLGA